MENIPVNTEALALITMIVGMAICAAIMIVWVAYPYWKGKHKKGGR